MSTIMEFKIQAIWDDEAKVWVANSDDLIGLVAEASTLEALEEKLIVLIPELIELNGINFKGHDYTQNYAQIPFYLHAGAKPLCMSS